MSYRIRNIIVKEGVILYPLNHIEYMITTQVRLRAKACIM